jgi:2-(1,2-epoxy-1,2-dihydrophenyl)acetyl-CoA isomerase
MSPTEGAELDISREGGVLRITLDRADARNALTIAMRDGIVDAVREARRDPDVRAVLLTGNGRAFCSGMDLGASTVMQAGRPDFRTRMTSEALREGVQTFIRELWELDKPTVAAVHGPAVGPGAHLALACDFVLVGPDTKFAWSFPKLGLVADAGGAYLLPRLVGLPRAKALVMLGETLTGDDALAAGMVYRKCASTEDVLRESSELAAQLAAGPTRSIGLSKRLLNEAFESDLAHSLELEGHFQALATTSPDLLEGMAAFREKRDAQFDGS